MALKQPASGEVPSNTKHRHTTALWMGAAFCASLGLAVVVLTVSGADTRGIQRALRLTARFSFLLFWFAYAGGALAVLFGSPFQAVARRGREFGLAFASALLVHVGLVVWLYRISAEPPVSTATLVFFGTGLMWTYLLALFSIKRLSQALGPGRWRLLRLVGLEYVSFAFLSDFITHPLHGDAKSLLGYLPFSILAVTGTTLRLAAWARRNAWGTRAALLLR
jgi:hypothetical protein